MSARSTGCARTTAVVVSMLFCAGTTLARGPFEGSQPAESAKIGPKSPEIHSAALMPAELAVAPAFSQPTAPPTLASPALPPIPGPFGLASADRGSYSARWQLLQPSIRVERQMLSLCRSNPAACPAAAAKFEAIVQSARAREGVARIGEVNRAVNLAIRHESDQAQYGVPDIWASPLMTFGSGAGDCEDYAIAKYVALIEAGVATEDLRLVIVFNRPAHEQHMVAAARVDGHWLILDNRTMRLVADNEVADLTPLAMLDGVAPMPAPAPNAQPAEALARSRDVPAFAVAL